jgi:hypothetical protein
MALPAWPVGVSHIARNDWQMSQMYVLPVATEMEGGNTRARSRPGSNVANVNYPLMSITLDEWAILETFIRTTLGNGASRFTMPVSIGADYVTKVVQIDPTKSPTLQRFSDYINITLPLKIWI